MSARVPPRARGPASLGPPARAGAGACRRSHGRSGPAGRGGEAGVEVRAASSGPSSEEASGRSGWDRSSTSSSQGSWAELWPRRGGPPLLRLQLDSDGASVEPRSAASPSSESLTLSAQSPRRWTSQGEASSESATHVSLQSQEPARACGSAAGHVPARGLPTFADRLDGLPEVFPGAARAAGPAPTDEEGRGKSRSAIRRKQREVLAKWTTMRALNMRSAVSLAQLLCRWQEAAEPAALRPSPSPSSPRWPAAPPPTPRMWLPDARAPAGPAAGPGGDEHTKVSL